MCGFIVSNIPHQRKGDMKIPCVRVKRLPQVVLGFNRFKNFVVS